MHASNAQNRNKKYPIIKIIWKYNAIVLFMHVFKLFKNNGNRVKIRISNSDQIICKVKTK